MGTASQAKPVQSRSNSAPRPVHCRSRSGFAPALHRVCTGFGPDQVPIHVLHSSIPLPRSGPRVAALPPAADGSVNLKAAIHLNHGLHGWARMEIVTGLRKTPASSPAGWTRVAAQALPIRVNPRNPWFEPPFRGPGLESARGAASRRWLCKPKSRNSPEPRITRMGTDGDSCRAAQDASEFTRRVRPRGCASPSDPCEN